MSFRFFKSSPTPAVAPPAASNDTPSLPRELDQPEKPPDVIVASTPGVSPVPPPAESPAVAANDRAARALRAKPPRPPPGGLSYVRSGQLIVVMGDVLYGKPQDKDAPAAGFVRANPVDLWESDAIPYAIEPGLPNTEAVQKAIHYLMETTAIRFVPFNGQRDAIVFQRGEKDCVSYLGRVGGHQPIRLDATCGMGEVLHEIMHALGFVHEQSRPDRDQFVQINWDQIQPDNRAQFEIAPDEVTKATMMAPFDYQSVMLYRPTAFVITPGMISVESRTSLPVSPTEDALSPGDIDRIRKLYGR